VTERKRTPFPVTGARKISERLRRPFRKSEKRKERFSISSSSEKRKKEGKGGQIVF